MIIYEKEKKVRTQQEHAPDARPWVIWKVLLKLYHSYLYNIVYL